LNLILKYFPDLTAEQIQQMGRIYELYAHWNEQINVISRKDIEQLYERHVLHSLGIAKVTSLAAGASVLDVGTGGGFPGIPLAILFPEARFHLVDSIGKKIKVVQEVAQVLGLNNVKAEQARAEELRGKYDFVVSRAVTQLGPFYSWVRNKLAPPSVRASAEQSFRPGILCLKGGDLTEELSVIRIPYEIFDLSRYFEEPFFETKKVVYISVG
jgi:16S rRNA (guanine527-N7)-methyltransferase